MNRSSSVFSFFAKLVVLLIFGPVILAVLSYWAFAMLAAMLPLLLAAAAIAGIAAGLTAGLVLRRRLPPGGQTGHSPRLPE